MKVPGRVQPALTPGVIQRKAVAPWIRETPKAPPAYRPQPVPKVLQTKVSQTTQAVPNRQKAMTFPVHKPPQVLQQRSVRATAGVVQGRSIAANVNRGRTILQTPAKLAGGATPKAVAQRMKIGVSHPHTTHANRTSRFNASQRTSRPTILETPASKAKPRPVVGVAPPTRPASGSIRSGLIQRYCDFPGCAIPACNDRRKHFAFHQEILARSIIPFAGNQAPDLLVDPLATTKHEHARYMNETILGGNAGKPGLENTLKTAASAIRYGGGMCNEYSAVVFAGLMQSPEISGQPICRYWNTEIGHSFTSFGDDRDPKLPQVIPDGWTLSRDPQFFRDTVMSGGTNHLKAMWTDRWPGEGQLEATEIPAAIARLVEAEQDPTTQQQLMQIWSVNAQHQQQIAYRLFHGERLPGIYSYPTNRRLFG